MIDKVLDFVVGGLTGLFLDVYEWAAGDHRQPDRHDRHGG